MGAIRAGCEEREKMKESEGERNEGDEAGDEKTEKKEEEDQEKLVYNYYT